MDVWLVIARCEADDVPLFCYATKEEARIAASTVTEDHVHEAGLRLYGCSVAPVVGLSLVRFTAGMAVEVVMVKRTVRFG